MIYIESQRTFYTSQYKKIKTSVYVSWNWRTVVDGVYKFCDVPWVRRRHIKHYPGQNNNNKETRKILFVFMYDLNVM